MRRRLYVGGPYSPRRHSGGCRCGPRGSHAGDPIQGHGAVVSSTGSSVWGRQSIIGRLQHLTAPPGSSWDGRPQRACPREPGPGQALDPGSCPGQALIQGDGDGDSGWGNESVNRLAVRMGFKLGPRRGWGSRPTRPAASPPAGPAGAWAPRGLVDLVFELLQGVVELLSPARCLPPGAGLPRP